MFEFLATATICLYSILEFFGDTYRGLGASNGRWVSFLQSVESAYSYRIQQPFRPANNKLSTPRKIRQRRQSVYYAGSGKNEIWRKLYLGFICGWLKFGSGTFISVVLGVEPTVAKGWRHFASFGVALMCIQLTPKDIFFKKLSERSTRGLLFRLCMFTACAIYKLKKMTFVVHTTRILGYHWGVAIFLCVVECEGSGVLRRAENQFMNITWSIHDVMRIFVRGIRSLGERVNFWLSIWVACMLTLGTHLGEEIDQGPSVYTVPWTLNAAALCILLARHCRTTLLQLWSMFFSTKKQKNDEEVRLFSLTSTPMRLGKRSSQKKKGKSSGKKSSLHTSTRKGSTPKRTPKGSSKGVHVQQKRNSSGAENKTNSSSIRRRKSNT